MKLYFLLIISLFFNYAVAQDDPVEERYYTLRNRDTNKAKIYCDSLIKEGNLANQIYGLGSKGIILGRENQNKEADFVFQKGLKLSARYKNNKTVQDRSIYLFNFYALYLIGKDSLNKALQTLKRAETLSKTLKTDKISYKIYDNYALLYNRLESPIEAYKVGLKTIKYYKKKPTKDLNIEGLLHSYLNQANRGFSNYKADRVMNKSYLDSSKVYAEKAKTLIEEFLIENPRENIKLLFVLGRISFFKKSFKKSLEYYLKSKTLISKTNYKNYEMMATCNIAKCYYFMENYKESLKLYQEIDDKELIDLGLKKFLISKNYYLFDIYQKTGDKEMALKYANKGYSIENIYGYKKEEILKDVVTTVKLKEINQKLEEYLLNHNKKQRKNKQLILFLIIVSISITYFLIKRQKIKYHKRIKRIEEKIKNQPLTRKKTIELPNDEKLKVIIANIEKAERQKLFLNPEFSLTLLAKKVSSNTNYVTQILKKHYDQTFLEYTNNLRINYVLTQLKSDGQLKKYTINYIAKEAGYKNVKSFNKHFKLRTKISASQYLKYLETES